MIQPLDLDHLERVAREATPGPWDGMFCSYAGTVDDPSSMLGFRFAPARYPIADLSKVNGTPKVGKGLLAEACTEEDRKHIAAFDPLTAQALIARLRAAEARADDAESSLAAAHERMREMIEALEPFAAEYNDAWHPEQNGGELIPDGETMSSGGGCSIICGQIRNAARVLADYRKGNADG